MKISPLDPSFKYTFKMSGLTPSLLVLAQIVMLVLLLIGLVPFWAGVFPMLVVGGLWMSMFYYLLLKGAVNG